MCLRELGEPAGWVGVGVMALKVSGAEDEAGVVMGVDAAEGRGWSAVMVTEDVVVRDVLIADIVGPVVGSDAALEAAVPPPSCGSVRNTGCGPACDTMLKSLLMNVGGVALEVPGSDTSKWHTYPSLSIIEGHEGRAGWCDRLVLCWTAALDDDGVSYGRPGRCTICIVDGVVGMLASEQQIWSEES